MCNRNWAHQNKINTTHACDFVDFFVEINITHACEFVRSIQMTHESLTFMWHALFRCDSHLNKGVSHLMTLICIHISLSAHFRSLSLSLFLASLTSPSTIPPLSSSRTGARALSFANTLSHSPGFPFPSSLLASFPSPRPLFQSIVHARARAFSHSFLIARSLIHFRSFSLIPFLAFFPCFGRAAFRWAPMGWLRSVGSLKL